MSTDASGRTGQGLSRHAAETPDAGEARWGRRHLAAASLRLAMVAGPIAACVAAMAVLSRTLPTPAPHSGTPPRIGWWVAVLIGSLIVMWLADRLTRRLAPLAALLDMAVLFPGKAPTRFAVARQAGDLRQLEALRKQATEAEQAKGLSEAATHILALVGALRAHDRHTRGHSERVRVYTDLIAEQLRLPASAVDRLRWAALLHDIGKLRVPAATLNKPAKLSSREWEVIREHPAEGARLAGALLPWLGEWGKAIAEHHERFDGTGYPNGLQGKAISLSGRIVAVADSFEVMTAPRSYKKAMTRPVALAEIVRVSGTQFDPEIVRALLQVSAPRLRWAMGPTSWLVGTPVLGSAPSLTGAAMVAQASVGATTVAVVGVTGLTGSVTLAPPAHSGAPPSSVTTSATSSHPPAAPRPAGGAQARPNVADGGIRQARDTAPAGPAAPAASTSPSPDVVVPPAVPAAQRYPVGQPAAPGPAGTAGQPAGSGLPAPAGKPAPPSPTKTAAPKAGPSKPAPPVKSVAPKPSPGQPKPTPASPTPASPTPAPAPAPTKSVAPMPSPGQPKAPPAPPSPAPVPTKSAPAKPAPPGGAAALATKDTGNQDQGSPGGGAPAGGASNGGNASDGSGHKAAH